MSIITSASSITVSRGYDYYKNGKVKNVSQLYDNEFKAYVKGSLKNPYYVKLDIKHPKKSYCDCPHANGNTICKHMVASYFELFPNEVDDYEAWLNNDYEDDEYDEYDEWDYDSVYNSYFDYDRNSYDFEKPLFFDVVLKDYVESLNKEQLKSILLDELKNNEKRTYDVYLKKVYKKYLNTSNSNFVFLDKINNKVKDLIENAEFSKEILNNKEKKKIKELYKDKSLQVQIDSILLNEKLSSFSDYVWIAKFYKSIKNSSEINKFCKKLEDYFDSLKHYGIKNTISKSNVLITLYILKNFTVSELANSLLKNAKYSEYVDYVINNNDNSKKLYSEFIKLINIYYFKNKSYILDVLYSFGKKNNFEDEDILFNTALYGFLCNEDISYLNILNSFLSEKNAIRLIESKTKNVFLLIKLYRFYDKKEKIWNLLINSNYSYLLINNIDVLKDKYNDELYKHFINEFYAVLKEGKKGEVYSKAMRYIKAILSLNDGEKYIYDLIIDLKDSEYKKCSLLFDKIYEIYGFKSKFIKK